MRRVPILVVSVVAPVLSIVVVAYGLRLEQAFGDTPAKAASTCGLAQPAFCDSLSSVYQGGGRTGQLDPSRWSVTRLTSDVNIGQGVLNQWYPSTLPICDQNAGSILPENDVRVCPPDPPPYFDELFNDGTNFAYNAFRPRQPFDFAGRTGIITFDSDAKTAGSHTWWLELWVTDQPVPAPTWSTIGVWAHPRNGIGVDFSGCEAASPGNPPGNLGGVQYLHLVNNYNVTNSLIANGANSNCYSTADGVRNHIEVHLSQQRLEVWASDAGGSNFSLRAWQDNLNLPFTRGYVNFEHVQYNAAKESVSNQQHYEWANLGFDGPVLPTPLGFDVADSLGWRGSNENLGYDLSGGVQSGTMRTCCPNGVFAGVSPFTLNNVNLSAATGAELNLNVYGYSPTSQLSYRFNNGPWRTIGYPFPDTNGDWRAVTAPVALSDLAQGSNTLELAAAQEVQVTNIDLTVETNSATPPPTPAATSSPTPTATQAPPSPVPANTTIPTNTPLPTQTAVPANTAMPTRTPLPPTPAQSNTPSAQRAAHPSFTSSASATPARVIQGSTVTVTASVTSATNASALVDVEIYDPSGARVLQRSYDNQTFAAGQTRTYTNTVQVPLTAQPGTYTVKVGTFSPGWGTVYNWNDHAGSYSVL
jgi:hypothetical protein